MDFQLGIDSFSDADMGHPLISLIDAPCLVSDGNGCILSCNQGLETLLACSQSALVGQPLAQILSPKFFGARSEGGAPRPVQAHRVGLSIPLGRRQLWLLSVESRGEPIPPPAPPTRIGVTVAQRDGLTGLLERSPFLACLGKALVAARKCGEKIGVICLDFDHLKYINNAYGLKAGDRVLREVGQRLQHFLGKEGVVARSGGDEFAIMLRCVEGKQDLSMVAGVLNSLIAATLKWEEQELNPSASLGIALFPDDGADPESLFSAATIAAAKAKEEGRDTFCFFDAELQHQVHELVSLDTYLHHALSKNQLYLKYQPQGALESGALVGGEVLARWHHERLGEVPPDRFIPVAERTGLIVDIGEWVLRTACHQYRRWADQGYALQRLAINLSPLQFRQANLLSVVKGALADSGVPPEVVELEITETSLMRDPLRATQVLREFCDMGIRVALDDFGTGYSSLGYLQSFPLHRIKIDRSFVKDLPFNANSRAIVRTILSLARNLQLQTIAEGVETVEQREFLLAEGCDEIQGYLLSRPLDAQSFATFMTQGPAH